LAGAHLVASRGPAPGLRWRRVKPNAGRAREGLTETDYPKWSLYRAGDMPRTARRQKLEQDASRDGGRRTVLQGQRLSSGPRKRVSVHRAHIFNHLFAFQKIPSFSQNSARPWSCTLARFGRIDRSNQGDVRILLRSDTPTDSRPELAGH
jgi:hypothetical protein